MRAVLLLNFNVGLVLFYNVCFTQTTTTAAWAEGPLQPVSVVARRVHRISGRHPSYLKLQRMRRSGSSTSLLPSFRLRVDARWGYVTLPSLRQGVRHLCRELHNKSVRSCVGYVTASHFLTFSPLHFVACGFESWHDTVFCLLPSQLSSGFLPYPLSTDFAISALVCIDFAFHLLLCVISFTWHCIYLAFAHVQTISTSN